MQQARRQIPSAAILPVLAIVDAAPRALRRMRQSSNYAIAGAEVCFRKNLAGDGPAGRQLAPGAQPSLPHGYPDLAGNLRSDYSDAARFFRSGASDLLHNSSALRPWSREPHEVDLAFCRNPAVFASIICANRRPQPFHSWNGQLHPACAGCQGRCGRRHCDFVRQSRHPEPAEATGATGAGQRSTEAHSHHAPPASRASQGTRGRESAHQLQSSAAKADYESPGNQFRIRRDGPRVAEIAGLRRVLFATRYSPCISNLRWKQTKMLGT